MLEAPPARGLATADAPMARLPEDGLVAIDKGRGPTSHDVVAAARRILRQRRVGHCGTLDPLATGVLVLCFGRYTRLAELLSDRDKDYTATICLGGVSDTYDADGTVETTPGCSVVPGVDDLETALAAFRGDILQVPPRFSAIKVNGVRSHRLARRGVHPTLQPRRVMVSRLALSRYEYPRVELQLTCSKGTYVRSLAHDLGQALGCGAYVEQLRRTRVGSVGLRRAVDLAGLAAAADAGALARYMLPVQDALEPFPRIVLPDAAVQRFARGNDVELEVMAAVAPTCAVFDESGSFWGLGEVVAGNLLKPRKVMPPSAAMGLAGAV